LRFVDFQDGGCPSPWNFEIEILTAIHFRGQFCVIALNFAEIGRTVAEISIFCVFQVKCKNSEDRAQYGTTLSKLEILQ